MNRNLFVAFFLVVLLGQSQVAQTADARTELELDGLVLLKKDKDENLFLEGNTLSREARSYILTFAAEQALKDKEEDLGECLSAFNASSPLGKKFHTVKILSPMPRGNFKGRKGYRGDGAVRKHRRSGRDVAALAARRAPKG